MKTTFFFIVVAWLGFAQPLLSQTSLRGKVTDDTGEPIIFGNVALYQNGVLETGTETDFDGYYSFPNLDPGIYDIKVSYVGYSPKEIRGVKVFAGKANKLDVEISADAVNLDEIVVIDYKVPLVEQDNTTSGSTIIMGRGGWRGGGRGVYSSPGRSARKNRQRKNNKKQQSLTAEQIKNLPTRNINSLATNSAGLSSGDANNQVAVRGSRSDANDYYIDGIRVSGNLVDENQQPIEQPTQKEAPTGEDYTPIVENAFIPTGKEVFSTFSIDVDKAAYSNVRRFINQGQLPPPDAVRSEELINYFNYNYPQPEAEHPFSVYSELSDCPWQEGHQLLHIGIKGYEASPDDAPPANLVFLIDVSGSMSSYNKLPLVKQALGLLIDQLRPQDRVAMVTYAGTFKVALQPTPGDQQSKIKAALNNLNSGGGTAGGPALERAYELAAQHFMPEGSNRIIMATDGDFNIGISNPSELEKFIAKKRQTGIYLSLLGFGMGNYKDDRLEALANKGNGNYAYIDNIQEAEKVFITEMAGTLFTIAKDVKLQLEFDSNTVESYRLIGYENRLLAKEDFEDDTKDAGELGAGHTVTALYEIVPKAGSTSKMATLHLRYKRPREEQSYYLPHVILNGSEPLESTTENFRFSAAVAAYTLCLRNSTHKGAATYDMALQLAKNARQDDLEGYRSGFVKMIKDTEKLSQQLAKEEKK